MHNSVKIMHFYIGLYGKSVHMKIILTNYRDYTLLQSIDFDTFNGFYTKPLKFIEIVCKIILSFQLSTIGSVFTSPYSPPPAPNQGRKSSLVSQMHENTRKTHGKRMVFTHKGDNVRDQMWKKSEKDEFEVCGQNLTKRPSKITHFSLFFTQNGSF